MNQHVKLNEHGRRIGESHPSAKLTDFEVDLILDMLDEREQTVRALTPHRKAFVRHILIEKGLDFRAIGRRFGVSHTTIHNIHLGKKRCQTIAFVK